MKKPPKKKATKRAPKPKTPATPATTPATPVARVRRSRAAASRTVDKRGAFLAAFSICGSIRHAAKAAHVNPRRHYEWMAEKDSDYPARFKQAHGEAGQSLEDEATYRAMVGVFEPNVYQGRWIYPQEEYEIEPAKRGQPARMGTRDVPGSKPLGLWKKSDALLMFRLRGEFPEKYRQYGSMELTGPGGGPIEIVERLHAARARAAARASEQPAAPPAPAPDDGNPTNYRN